jgi:hypothetical protein
MEELRKVFEEEFHCERNSKGFYEDQTDRLLWLACKFGYEWKEKGSIT